MHTMFTYGHLFVKCISIEHDFNDSHFTIPILIVNVRIPSSCHLP